MKYRLIRRQIPLGDAYVVQKLAHSPYGGWKDIFSTDRLFDATKFLYRLKSGMDDKGETLIDEIEVNNDQM